jgi:hypothetical protein
MLNRNSEINSIQVSVALWSGQARGDRHFNH